MPPRANCFRFFAIISAFYVIGCASPATTLAQGATYHVSPDQDLGAAVKKLKPGDTLVLRDGVYRQPLSASLSGTPGRPITIRAQNDGGAIIDGEFKRQVVVINRKDYIVIEGLVGRNSNRDADYSGVYVINRGSHNVLRRCTGYNASNDRNGAVFSVLYKEAQHNLLEDCAAWGTGRKMFVFFLSEHNTMRRCFARWTRWDGRKFENAWPNGSNLQFYGANHCVMENCIGVGPVPAWFSVNMRSQYNTPSCIGNRFLGTIVIQAGMNEDGTPKTNWGPWPYRKVPKAYKVEGLNVSAANGKPNRDNVLRDCFAWGNLGVGLKVRGPVRNLTIDRVTLRGNVGGSLSVDKAAKVTITDSSIEGTSHRGAGARLTHRYVDGKLTNEPLWPWPMEERIKKEMGGYSVTERITKVIGVRVASVKPPTRKKESAANDPPHSPAGQPGKDK